MSQVQDMKQVKLFNHFFFRGGAWGWVSYDGCWFCGVKFNTERLWEPCPTRLNVEVGP